MMNLKNEYYQITGVKLSDSYHDLQKLHLYSQLRELYSFEQIIEMRKVEPIEIKSISNYHYSIDQMNESVIVAHIKQINEKNGFDCFKNQFKKQSKEIIENYELGQIRHALHQAERMKLNHQIGFTFVKSLIDKKGK